MKENHTSVQAPSTDPGPEGPAVGMAIRQDPAQGARAAGPEGDIAAGGSIFGPDGTGQFVRLGGTMPQPADKSDENAPNDPPMGPESPETARKTSSIPETALNSPQKTAPMLETARDSGPHALNARPAAAFTARDSGGGNGQQPLALPSGKPAALLEAKTIDRLRRRLFDKRRTHGREARQLPEGTTRARSRSTWTKTIMETITAIQTFQAGPPPARPDGKKRIDPRELSRSWKGRIIAYFVFEQPEVPNTAIAELLEMTPSAVGWRRRKIIDGEARPELVNTGTYQIMARLTVRKDHLQRKAIAKEDYALAWRIECEYITKLQDLGAIPRTPVPAETMDESRNFSLQIQEFINVFGAIPTPAEFLANLRPGGAGGTRVGNGNGNPGPGLLERPPGWPGPAGTHPENGDPHRR